MSRDPAVETVFSRLARHAAARPDRVALEDAEGTLTYSVLHDRALAAAGVLHRAGARRGDTAALVLDPSSGVLQTAAVLYGLKYLGAIVLPLYPDVPRARRRELVERFGASWFVNGLGPGPDIPRVDAGAFGSPAGAAALPPRGDDAAQPCLYHFTSGTTGTAKAYLFSAAQLARWSYNAMASIGSSPADRIVPARPWPEMVGLRALLRIHAAGGTLVNAAVPETREHLLRLVEELKVTEISISPFQLRRLLKSDPYLPGTRASLRVMSVAGGLISPQEIQAARDTLTPNFYVDYGTNETGRLALLRPGDPCDATGAVGNLIPGIEGEAVDDADVPLPPGSTGLLRFRADWLPREYVGDPAASGARFRHGWFYPGDRGSIDPYGRVIVLGRDDDVINFGGLKLLPSDIEPVLAAHPHVVEAAVIAAPDPLSGQIAVACVVLRKPTADSELREFCAARMESSRAPAVYFGVSEMPRTREGKVDRRRLLDLYRASLVQAPATPR